MPPKGKRPAHQNKKAFHGNPHSVKTAKIQALPNEGLCQKCHDIIEWKKKYHKFKPLKAPRKCDMCGERTVVHAYHTVCTNCARSSGVCAKCREARGIVRPVVTPEERAEQKEDIALKLMTMTLREKRTFYRVMDREHPEFFSDDDDDDDCCGCGDCKKGGSHGKKCSGGHDHCHCHDSTKVSHDHDHGHCESSEDEADEVDDHEEGEEEEGDDDGFDDLDERSEEDE